jgi:hypothetical protein
MAVNITDLEARPEPSARPTWHLQALLVGTKPRRSSSAGEVVLAYLRQQAHTMMSLEPMVRADEFDSVHQMRVATRRLRATLRSFGRVTVIARQAARELGIGAHLAGENAFTYGLLYECERYQAVRLQRRARATWQRASRPATASG